MQQDQNPNVFLAAQEAQQIIGGSYTESDIARASLVQMNEISRRAEVARMSFGGTEAGESRDAEAEDARDPAGMLVAAAGLMGWDEDPSEGGKGISMSREEALTRIEELQRSRPSSAQGMDIAGVSAFGTGVSECDRFVIPEDSEPVAVGPNEEPDEWVGSSSTSADTNTGVSDGEAGAGGLTGSTHQGLQVYTLGHLMPRSTVVNGNWSLDPDGGTTVADAASAHDPGSTSGPACVMPEQPSETVAYTGDDDPSIAAGPIVPGTSVPRSSDIVPPSEGASTSTSSSQKLRVRRSTFVPGWAVPPRVLLVDDDAVSRKLSSKFLQVFGCTIDVAVDGVGAVNKMNLEKYDLVLMVRPLFYSSPTAPVLRAIVL
jgi:osomolarity two-component system response regulator SKN7